MSQVKLSEKEEAIVALMTASLASQGPAGVDAADRIFILETIERPNSRQFHIWAEIVKILHDRTN